MDKRIKAAKILANLLDSQFNFVGIKFGLDPIINLIPWAGSIIGALLSLFIIHTAYKVGVSKKDMSRMIVNIIIDFILGIIPYIGIVFDVAFKSNIYNVKILQTYSHGKFIEGEIVG